MYRSDRLNRTEHRSATWVNTSPPQKIGPLWKLVHVVEPRPVATEVLTLRDEKAERFVIDGPFTETKS